MIAIKRTARGNIRIDGMATDSGSELGWAEVTVNGEVVLVGTHASCAPSASALAAGIEMAKARLVTMPQPKPVRTVSDQRRMERAYDEIHNEGEQGYNPYRASGMYSEGR